MRSLALPTCLLAAISGKLLADPLTSASLPDGTRWVMHVDVDAARLATPLWDLARVKIFQPRSADLAPKLVFLERATGMTLPDQLHDVTLYGTAFDPASACIRIRGNLDKDNLTALLRAANSFSQVNYTGHDVISWLDDGSGQMLYAGFDAHLPAGPANTWIIVSHEQHAVELALDAMDGKATLKSDSPLSPPGSAVPGSLQPLFWIAARDVSELPRVQKVESPLLLHVDAASLSLRWANNHAVANLRVDTKSAETARQFQAVAEGAKAFVALSAADEHAPPKLRMLSSALDQLNVQTEGKTVKGEWSVEVEKIETLMNLALQDQTDVPATAAGQH